MAIPFRVAPAPIEANARIRNRQAPSPEQEHAHHLWHEGYLSQAEIAKEIERLFQTPYTQSHVSRAVKRVDAWLQAIKASPPVRAQADGRRGPKPERAQAQGARRRPRVVRKVVDECDD